MVDESNPVISRFTNKIKELINNKADKTNATQSNAGLMSAEDKIKLDAIDTQYSIDVEKQSTAEYGFFSTYVIKQNNTQKGVKINIPKDFLVKSATVKTCTTANSPVSGYEVGDKYIDLVINSKDSTDTDEHLYLATKEIGAYPVDEVTLTVDNGKLTIKDNSIQWAKLSTVVRGIINGKEDINNKVNSVSASSTITQYPSAKCVYDTFCQGNDPRLSDSRSPKFININASSTSPKDLDDYRTGGFYYISNDNNASYISNCPLTSTRNRSFFLLVETWGESSNYVKQTLTYYYNQKTYIRTKRNTAGWDDWHLIQTTNPHIPSTHTSSISDWTGTSNEIVSLTTGVVIYYFLRQEPTTNPVTLDLTLANGDTTGAKNVYFNSNTRLSNQYGKFHMIGLYYTGTEWLVISPYSTNHTHSFNNISRETIGANANFDNYMVQGFYKIDYASAQSSTNMPDKFGGLLTVKDIYNGVSQTFQKYGKNVTNIWYRTYYRTDGSWSSWKTIVNDDIPDNTITTAKLAPRSVTFDKIDPTIFWGSGSGSGTTAGYIKMIKFKFTSDAAWRDKPITFDLYNRTRKDNIHVSLKFKNVGDNDPDVDYFSYTSYDAVNLYIYKEETSTWSVIIQKETNGNMEIANLTIPSYNRDYLRYYNMNTQISALPSNTSTNPLIQATQRTYGGTSINNITAPAFIKSGGTSSQFLKGDGSVETLNTTPFTVTYTNGTTSTINFVTR